MVTKPRLDPGEVPLDAETVRRLIASLGDDMILVGGQALAFWMHRYGVSTNEAVVSNDGDALGARGAAETLARRLGGKLLVPPASARTSLVAQVRLRRADGKVANVDVLHKLYTTGGLKKSGDFTRHVIERSVEVELENGVRFRVMDPFDVLDSRVQNAAGLLEEKGRHVLTQARWAIQLASAVLLKLAKTRRPSDTAVKRLGSALSDIFKLAHSQAGRTLWMDHGIDVLEAIEVQALQKLAPVHEKQLEKVLDARRARLASVSTPGPGGKTKQKPQDG